jgi:hypothetical protein
VVLSGGIRHAVHLPGGLIVLNRTLVEDFDTPEVAAGFTLAEDELARQADPLQELLTWTGMLSAAKLLVTGNIPEQDIAEYAQSLMLANYVTPPTLSLIGRFSEARVPSSPYAFALDVTGEKTLDLIEADPIKPEQELPILADGDWIALQGVCGE